MPAMLNNRAEILKDARTIRTKQIAEDRERAAALVENLTAPQVHHPEDDGTGMIYWTRAEQEKLLDLCRAAKNKAMNVLKWEGMTDNGRRYFSLKIAEAVQDKFFPPHRRRTVTGVSSVPFQIQHVFREIFDLKDPAKELLATSLAPVVNAALTDAPPVPEATPVPNGHTKWTWDEETALLTHLANVMVKQWGNHIPTGDDRTGSIMFKDMIVSAQNAVIPEHRRRDLGHARQIFEKSGLMERLQKRLDEVAAAAKAASTASNPPIPVQGTHVNGKHHAANIEAASLADLLRAVADKIESTFAKIEKENAETKALCDELLADNSALRNTVTGLENRLTELQNDLGGPAVPKKQLPRVAVLGCHLDEFTNIMAKAKEHGLELEFKHYDQDQTPAQIRGDYALMLKWASAAWMQKMKESGIPADRRAIVQGGISRAVMQLEAWFAPEPEHARAM